MLVEIIYNFWRTLKLLIFKKWIASNITTYFLLNDTVFKDLWDYFCRYVGEWISYYMKLYDSLY